MHSELVLVQQLLKMMMIQSSSWNSYRCFIVVLLMLSLVKLVAVRVGPFHSRCSGEAVVIDCEVLCKSATTMPIEWFPWLAEVGMEKHGRLMVMNHLEEVDIVHFDHDLLRSIGVHSAKDRLLILSQKKKHIRSRVKAKSSLSSQITSEAQSTIIKRVQVLHVDEVKLLLWAKKTWLLCNRDVLQQQGYLSSAAPLPGSSNLVMDTHRTPQGTELLNSAKDMLWAALYGSAEENVEIARVERELLVITIPGQKAFVFNFFRAVTEVGALGTWRDPDKRCDDNDAPNMLLQVEYGESTSEIVGDAIMVAIHMINLLEVNEVLLYARSSNIEQSTLSTQLFFQKQETAKASTMAEITTTKLTQQLQQQPHQTQASTMVEITTTLQQQQPLILPI